MAYPLQQLAQIIVSIDNAIQLSSLSTFTVAVQTLDDLFASNSKKIVQNIDKLIQILFNAINQPGSCQLLQKAHLFDFIVAGVHKYPKLAKSKSNRGSKLFKLALDIICQTSTETTEQWMNPPDGFKADQQQDKDSQTVSQMMSSVDCLAQAIGFNQTIVDFQPIFIEYVQKQEDWRTAYSALLIGSQISVDLADVQSLTNLIQYSLSLTDHFHPKVRYAALQLLGQYSQDLGHQFQQIYYSSLVPIATKLLNDPVPRVVAHTFACMTNFFEKCKELSKLQSVLGQYLTPIIHYIRTGNTWIKEAALSTLGSLATTQGAFGPNLPSIFELAAEIITSSLGNPQYKQVLSQSFELVSILLAKQKKQLVQGYLNDYVNLLFSHKASIDQFYFLQCWNRLCLNYQQFTDINQVYPILLEEVKNQFDQYIEDGECAQNLCSLQNTLKSFKTIASAFATQTQAFAKQVYLTSGGSKVKEQAILLIAATHTTTKPAEPYALSSWFEKAKRTQDYFTKLIQSKIDQPDDRIQQIVYLYAAVRQLIMSFENCLSTQDLLILSRKHFSLIKIIDEAHMDYSVDVNAENDQEQSQELNSQQTQLDFSKEFLNTLEEAIEQASTIMEELLKLSIQPTTKNQMLQLYLKEINYYLTRQPLIVCFGVNLAVDILNNCTYNQIKAEYPNITQILYGFLQHPQPKTRNVAVYGFKLVISKINPSDIGAEEVSKLLQSLGKSFTTQFLDNPSDKDDIFFKKHCKDNVISAVGCLLKYFGNVYPGILHQNIYKFWMQNLPLNVDKSQGNEQQQILIEMLSASPALLINNAEDLLKICQIYANFVIRRGKTKYKWIVSKTKESLLMMKQWSLFSQSSDYLWGNLNESQKKALLSLTAN